MGRSRRSRRSSSPVPSPSSSEEAVPTAREEEEEQEGEEQEQEKQHGEDHEGREGVEEGAIPRVWLRGPSMLPTRPISEAGRPVIRPDGKR